MGNRRNWNRRNKKCNNWKLLMKIKKEKKANENRVDDRNLPQSNTAQNNVDSIQIDDNYFACLINEQDTNASFDSNQEPNDETDPLIDPLLSTDNSVSYIEDLDEEENVHYEHSEENSDDGSDEDGCEPALAEITDPLIDPLLSTDNSVSYIEDLDEEENVHYEHSEENSDDGSDEDGCEPALAEIENDPSSDDDQEDVIVEEKFNGCRIFTDEIFHAIKRIGRHSRNCTFEDMVLIGELKRGFNSIFKFKCKKCGVIRKLESCPKKPNKLNCNENAVLGITSIGSGHYHLNELFTNLDIPVMGNTLYDKIQKGQQQDWEDVARQSALDALYEEIELAKTLKQVDANGNALIIAICDAGWGKRSYGKAFNSLSGCAVLIGLRTGKVIYFGTRNKYCHTCKIAESRNTPVNEHVCNINYKGPSSGMESDIIVLGFMDCEQHGARFHQLVADGDSNTYKNLRDSRIYQNPDVFIEKFECVNHLHRNFRAKFRMLSTVTKFDCDLRKHVKPKRGRDISIGVKSAAKHWRESNLSTLEKIANLEEDIMNAPCHYFGVHDKCKSYFCNKTTEEAAIDNLNLLKEDGIYYEVLNMCQHYFAGNAKSLLENHTNNPAEEFNNVVAKYIGGKRINYSLARSYSARVAAAVVHYNSGGHASTEFRKFKFGTSDNKNIELLENSRKRKLISNETSRQLKPNRRMEKREREQLSEGVYYHGDGCEYEDKTPAAFEKAKTVLLEKLKNNQRNWRHVEASTRGGKFNPKWHQVRQDLIPSTFFARIAKVKKPMAYKNILDDLMYKRTEFGNNAANKHQRLVQRDALKVFESLFDDHALEDRGIFIDKKQDFLCASPYKFYGRDHILQIVCPLKLYGKEFDDVIDKIKLWKRENGFLELNEDNEWFIELQSDMHITDRKYGFIMVWLGEAKGKAQYRIVQIPKDDSFFEKSIKKNLVYFYEEVMIKELVDSRQKRHMKLREYDSAQKLFV